MYETTSMESFWIHFVNIDNFNDHCEQMYVLIQS